MKESMAELDKTGKSVGELIDSYDPLANNFDLGMKGYYLRRIGSLLADYWTSDSAVYDLEAGTSNLAYLTERTATNPKKQFMVAVDFHH
jgi:hypothetical protein